jgi:uncharacterized protein YacL
MKEAANLNSMKGIRQALLMIGSVVALIIAVLASYFVFADPGILSVLLFVTVMPVFAILGIGLFAIARDEFRLQARG